MKKLLSLALALVLCVSLAACGGKEPAPSEPAEPAPAESAPEPAPESNGGNEEQTQALSEAYNQVVDVYNEVADAAEANGWMADEAVAAEISAIGESVEPIGTALSEDMSLLEGEDLDALPGFLTDEILPQLQALNEKVSVPYEEAPADEGGSEDEPASGTAVVTGEALKPLAEVYNEIAPSYNELYETAEANGWMEDEQTAAEIQALGATMSYIGAGLTEDPSILEDVDIDGLTEQLGQFPAAMEEIAERVSVPYGG